MKTIFSLSISLSIILCIIGVNINLGAQCSNNTNYPLGVLIAPDQNDTLEISVFQYAGDYVLMSDFLLDFEYQVMSNIANDFITVRTYPSDSVLAFGLAPLTFIASTDSVSIHVNLSQPMCGTEDVNRQTSISNSGIPVNKVGVNKLEPEATLDVNGIIKVADDPSDPKAGMIRFNTETQDFEGYNGVKWRSLTSPNGNLGKLYNPEHTQTSKLKLGNASPLDNFGQWMDHDGQRLLVSVPNKDVGNNINQGRVYVYEDNGAGYVLADSLDDPNAREGGKFGDGDVVVKGDYVIVGTTSNIFNNGVYSGSATIFKKSGNIWITEANITEYHVDTKVIGGQTIDIYPPYALATSPINGNQEVFIYKNIGGVWSELHKESSPNMLGLDGFGSHAILDDNSLFISDPYLLGNNGRRGIIYHYENDGADTYDLIDSIFPNLVDPNVSEHSRRFNVYGNYLVIGDYEEVYDQTTSRGAVDIHHYENSEWTLEKTLRAPFGSEVTNFGYDVDIQNEEIIVGSRIIDSGYQLRIPKVFVYKKIDGDWNNTNILIPDDPYKFTWFGRNIVIGTNEIFVSDHHDTSHGGSKQGTIYIYEK